MADVKAFRGYRYRLDNTEDLGLYAAPPYDMVDESLVESLYAKGGHNAIRIIQNRAEQGDASNRVRHQRAAGLFKSWIAQGLIKEDAVPAVYGYRQKFSIGSGSASGFERSGVIVLVKLTDYAEGVVQPHEYTLSGPKVDRYELLEELKFDTGLIFGIVPDDGALYGAIKRVMTGQPQGAFTDRDKVTHELFAATDAQAIAQIGTIMAGRTILIADGHHRYETSLSYYRNTKDPAAAYVMMALVSMADPGLIIRPFHRLIKDNELTRNLRSVKECREYFTCTDLGAASERQVLDFVANQGEWEMLSLDKTDNHLYGLTAGEPARKYLQEHPNGMSEEWNALNVSRINRLCVEAIMGQKLDGKILHDALDYVNDTATAFAKATSDKAYSGAFFIRSIDINTVKQIVSRSERMPQKSTNFFPKLYSGLVFNPVSGQA